MNAFDLAARERDDLKELVRMDIQDTLMFILDRFVYEAPVLTGRFRNSLEVYRDTPPVKEGMSDRGDVLAIMNDWEPGEEAGLVSMVPYGPRLADGYSPQAPAGWIDAIGEDAAARRGSR